MRRGGESEKTERSGNGRDIFFAVKRERFSCTAVWFCVYVYCFCWRLIFSPRSLAWVCFSGLSVDQKVQMFILLHTFRAGVLLGGDVRGFLRFQMRKLLEESLNS